MLIVRHSHILMKVFDEHSRILGHGIRIDRILVGREVDIGRCGTGSWRRVVHASCCSRYRGGKRERRTEEINSFRATANVLIRPMVTKNHILIGRHSLVTGRAGIQGATESNP